MLSSYDLATIAGLLREHTLQSDPDAPARPAEPEAAVAAILRQPAGEPGIDAEILLMRRAEHPQDPWSGHMAFPGGRRDPGDDTLLATAMRETLEEVGLDLARHGRLLARLEAVPAVARGRRIGLTITPFVFALTGGDADAGLPPPELVHNHEVAETVWTPLGALARGETRGTFAYDHEGTSLDLPCLYVGERRVWGLTYQMLQAFFATLHRSSS